MTNGTFAYEVDSVPGFVAAPSAGKVMVNGPPLGTVSIAFQVPNGNASSASRSAESWLVAELLGGVGAGALIVSWVVWRRIRRKPEPDWYVAP